MCTFESSSYYFLSIDAASQQRDMSAAVAVACTRCSGLSLLAALTFIHNDVAPFVTYPNIC